MESAAPLPPRALALRAGVPDPADVIGSYRAVGRDSRATILELLGPGWSWEGNDIDQRSIAWLQRELSPPLHAFVNRSAPPLDQPDGVFDLVWSVSVFTRITDHWAGWLAELHRVLAPGGLAILSFLDAAMYETWTGGEWDEDSIGMTVLNHGQDWELGGPTVFHSPWWLGGGHTGLQIRVPP
jgi:SAM-dependent methyltransferase